MERETTYAKNKQKSEVNSLTLFILISILSITNQLILIDQTIISSLTDGLPLFVVSLMELVTLLASAEIILILLLSLELI